MNLGELYAQYVEKDEKTRAQDRLFVTDVGKCPRQVGYRLLGQEKDYQSPQEKINKLIMFDIADHLEATLWDALCDNGMEIDYQFPCEMLDRVNWGGRGDIIADYNGRRIIEVKSLYPGAFSHEIEYPAHQHQARIYDHYCHEIYELTAPPLLWYVDRGGQNTPVEQDHGVEWDGTKCLMDELDMVRDLIAEHGKVGLPKLLPRRLMLRSYGKVIQEEGPWECTRCDYHWTCEPNMSKNVWARRATVNDLWEHTKIADPDRLIPFVDSLIEEALS